MNCGKNIFSQIFKLVSHYDFIKCVNQYKGSYKTKHFTWRKEFFCISFGQLTNGGSLSDTILCIKADESIFYHPGIGKATGKSTLSKTFGNYDWRIYQDSALLLLDQAKKFYENDNQLKLELKNSIFIIDSSGINLCLSPYLWIKFRHHKSAV